METDKIKYGYGDTPEEVIRERFIEDRGVKIKIGPHTRGAGELLLVLEALSLQSWAGADAENGQIDGPTIEAYRVATPAGKLRIEMLAALGIDEGSE